MVSLVAVTTNAFSVESVTVLSGEPSSPSCRCETPLSVCVRARSAPRATYLYVAGGALTTYNTLRPRSSPLCTFRWGARADQLTIYLVCTWLTHTLFLPPSKLHLTHRKLPQSRGRNRANCLSVPQVLPIDLMSQKKLVLRLNYCQSCAICMHFICPSCSDYVRRFYPSNRDS